MFIGMLVALALFIRLIAATREITGPLAIGVFLAIVFVPIVNWLEEHSINRALGAAIVLVGLIVVIGGAGLITAEAPGSQSDVLTEHLEGAVDEIKALVEDLPISEAAPVARDGVGV